MKIFLTLLCLCISLTLVAHGPIHELILQTTQEIKEDPDNASLYVKRAEFYRIDDDFDKCVADLLVAKKLAPETPGLDYLFAQIHADNGYPNTGMHYIQKVLDETPDHINALQLRASIYIQMKEEALAIKDFDHSLSIMKQPRPQHFIDIAKATLRADSTDYEGAISWLNKGEERLGFNIVMRSFANELDVKFGNYDRAIKRLDEVIGKFKRHDKWLLEKAQILETAKRLPEARDTYKSTLAAIRSLPKSKRSTKMVMEWEADSIMAIERIEKALSNPGE